MPPAPGRPALGRIKGQPDHRLPAWHHVSRPVPGTLPADLDHTAGVQWFGSMGNTNINNCTCAAFYHARQIWALNTGRADARSILAMDGDTEGEHDALRLYSHLTGFDRRAMDGGTWNPTDCGAYEQDLLRLLRASGAPVGGNGHARDVLLAHLGVNPRNLDHLRTAIWQCGVVYVSILCPSSWRQTDYAHQMRWDEAPGTIDPPDEHRGHALVLAGYDATGFLAISWGKVYHLSTRFVARYVDEAHALVDRGWLNGKRTTPAGLTADELTALMLALE